MSRLGTYDLVDGFVPYDDCQQEEPKMTNSDRIRAMTDEELAELIGDNIDCSICKKEVFETTTCPGSLTADEKNCYGCWLDWLKKEVVAND